VLDLDFRCLDAAPERYAASPTISLQLQIRESTGACVGAMVLRCQVRIDPRQRAYSPREEDRMVDLFGDRTQWERSLQPIQLASLTHTVPQFAGEVVTSVPMALTGDVAAASGKYFQSLDDGEVPLSVLFSGTAFLVAGGAMAVEPVPWHHEAKYRLPVKVWRDAMDVHFPDTGWIALRRDSIDALRAYAAAEVIAGPAEAVERLLEEAGWSRR
jgi:hypothetical protein